MPQHKGAARRRGYCNSGEKNALKDCTEALGTGTSRFLTRAPEDALDVGELAEYGGGKLDRVWSSGGVEAWD
jgi:hypothetical protein